MILSSDRSCGLECTCSWIEPLGSFYERLRAEVMRVKRSACDKDLSVWQ